MPARKQKAKAPKTNVFICQPSYRQDCSRDLRTLIHVAMLWPVVSHAMWRKSSQIIWPKQGSLTFEKR
jgi:hypothetical protein